MKFKISTKSVTRSAEDLEYISEQMRTSAGSQLSQWELFLKDLYHDLMTYKEAYQKLEKLMKQKEIQHQNYVGSYIIFYLTTLLQVHIKSLCTSIKLRIHSQTPIVNIVFVNMFGKFIFPQTSDKPGENDERTAPAVT